MKLHRAVLFCSALALLATEPNDATKRWWAHIVALANDGMEGRNTGSEGYRKAERYVIAAFEIWPFSAMVRRRALEQLRPGASRAVAIEGAR